MTTLSKGLIQSGKVTMPTDNNMQNGNGNRILKSYVKFPQKFTNVPKVVVFFKTMDVAGANREDSIRLNIDAIDVTSEGFNAQFGTWAGTHLWGAEAQWFDFSN